MHPITRFFVIHRLIASTLLCLSTVSVSLAQLEKEDCDYLLKDVQINYNMGLLDDVLSSDLIDCLVSSNKRLLTRQDKVAAYRLFTESFLFMNQIDSASRQYEKLLLQDPLHRVTPNDKTASYDLIYLSNTYRKKPIFSLYGNIGVNYSRIKVLQPYSIDNSADKNYDATGSNIGVSGGLGFEIPVWEMTKPLPIDFDLVLEVNAVNRVYNYKDSLYLNVTQEDARFENPDESIRANITSEPLLYGSTTFIENQLWMDIPLMVKINWRSKKDREKASKVVPYVYVGMNNSFLLNAQLKDLRRSTIEESDLDAVNKTEEKQKHRIFSLNRKGEEGIPEPLRSGYNVSLLAGAGLKLRLERNYFFLDLRYNHFFLNNVNRKNRYSDIELLYSFAYVDSDFRTSNAAFTLGFAKSFYTPTKKRRYNDIVLRRRLDRMIRRKKAQASNTPNRDLRDQLNRNIRDLERRSGSSINRVKNGLNRNKQEIDKARGILKGGPDVNIKEPKINVQGPSIKIN